MIEFIVSIIVFSVITVGAIVSLGLISITVCCQHFDIGY